MNDDDDDDADIWGKSTHEELAEAQALADAEAPTGEDAEPYGVTRRPMNDLGIVERFIDRQGSRIRYVRTKTGGHFTHWDHHRWSDHSSTTTVKGLLIDTILAMIEEETPLWAAEDPKQLPAFQKWAGQQQSAAKISAIMRLLEQHPALSYQFNQYDVLHEDDFDAHSNLLNFTNCTMDTRSTDWPIPTTRNLRGQYLTQALPIPFMRHAKATCPNWLSFLQDNIPDEATRDYFHRAVGYTLSGDANEKILMWLYGPANTGKSLIINTLTRLFGPHYGHTASEGALRPRGQHGGGPSPEIDNMRNKLFVAASETGHGQEIDEALVKRLTGGDEINSRPMYGHERRWRPRCVIWVASNQFPQPRGDDDAIWERFRPIEFNTVYGPNNPKRDIYLGDRLAAQWEMYGIGVWAVEGLENYRSEGLGPIPHVMQMSADRFREDADPVRRFMLEAQESGKITISESERCVRGTLFGLYQQWATAAGSHPYSNRRFYTRLAAVPGVLDVDCKSNSQRYVRGVGVVSPTWQTAPEARW
jgi:putative DNA primase/helicase